MPKKVGCFTISQSAILADGLPVSRNNTPWYIQRLQDAIVFVNQTMGQNYSGIKEIIWSNYDKIVFVSHYTAGSAMYHVLANPKEFLQFLLPDIVRFAVSKHPTYDYLHKLHELENNPPLYYQ